MDKALDSLSQQLDLKIKSIIGDPNFIKKREKIMQKYHVKRENILRGDPTLEDGELNKRD